MSLFTSIQIAKNALFAAQTGLQVTGNNIANVNTPGFNREEVVLVPAPTQRVGNLVLGLGVEVAGIIQRADQFLSERNRSADSDLATAVTQEDVYRQLESLIGELSDTDLSTSLTTFFGSIHDVLNQQESISVRNLAVLQGDRLANDVQRLANRVRTISNDINSQIVRTTDDINRLLSEVDKLNIQIMKTEGGGTSNSDAVGLRDARGNVLAELASIIGVNAIEQSSGSVTVFAGGDFLVFDGIIREVETVVDPQTEIATINLASTQSPLETSAGRLNGLITSRDVILAGFLESLDEFAAALIFEFNKTYSSGQGLVGYDELTSEFTVDATDVPLDGAGLTFTPVTGSFEVMVLNKQTGLHETTDAVIRVNLNGVDGDTTLDDLVASLNSVDGIFASITPSRGVTIRSDSSNLEFAFANDTSGVLAALGLATFFTGTGASNIGVSQVGRDDPAKFATSRGGIGLDSDNAVLLGQFLNTALDSQNGFSIFELYDRLAGETTQGASVTRAIADGFRVFQQTLEAEFLALTGVNIDEEIVRMISFQRAYQASARFIVTISDLLDVLVNL